MKTSWMIGLMVLITLVGCGGLLSTSQPSSSSNGGGSVSSTTGWTASHRNALKSQCLTKGMSSSTCSCIVQQAEKLFPNPESLSMSDPSTARQLGELVGNLAGSQCISSL